MLSINALSQNSNSIQIPDRKRFIDKIEILLGPMLSFPDDNGFSERLKQTSSGTILDSYNSKFGYSLGIGVGHTVSKKFDLNARLLWEQRGFVQEKTTIGGTDILKYEGDQRINCLSFTATTDFYFSANRKLYAYSGFYFSKLQSSFRKETVFTNNQPSFTGSTTDDPNLKDDFGLIVGVGYGISISNRHLLNLRLQGNYGLSKIIDVNTLAINNTSVCFYFGYTKKINT